MTKDEAVKLALSALETVRPYEVVDYIPLEEAITALRQALEQTEREWVGLTEADVINAWATSKGDVLKRLEPFARAIEAKLKEKNI